jgi:hypothetical protein
MPYGAHDASKPPYISYLLPAFYGTPRWGETTVLRWWHAKARRAASSRRFRVARSGIKLTESYAVWPNSAVSGFYFSHPDSRYFGITEVRRDQASRKGITLEEAERWLAPNLA